MEEIIYQEQTGEGRPSNLKCCSNGKYTYEKLKITVP